MSLATLIQSTGFAVLLQTDGELLTYSKTNASIRAVVNRDVTAKDMRRLGERAGHIDFEPYSLTIVEFPRTAVAARPQAGERFVDAFNWRHRVRFVQQSDIAYLCVCEQSDNSV